MIDRLLRLGLIVVILAVAPFATARLAASDYCYDSCGVGTPCDWQCLVAPGEWTTCGEWGICYDDPCEGTYCGDEQCQTACESGSWCSDCPFEPENPDCDPPQCSYGSGGCSGGYECNEHSCCVPIEEGGGGPELCVIHQDCNYPLQICVNGRCIDVMAWY